MNTKTKAKILLGILASTNFISIMGSCPTTYAMREMRASNGDNRAPSCAVCETEASYYDESDMDDSPTASKRPATTNLVPLSPQEFFSAVQHKDKQTIRYLYNHSLDINTRNPMGWTPLHYAVWLDNLKMVKFLVLKCHALVNLRDKSGMTPYDVAVINHSRPIIDFFTTQTQN